MTTSASCRRWWVGEASKPHPLDATINTLYSPPPTRRKAQAARRVTQKRIDNRPSDTDRPHAPRPPWLPPGRVCIRDAGPMGPRWRLRDAGGPRRSGRGRRLGAPPRLHAEHGPDSSPGSGPFCFLAATSQGVAPPRRSGCGGWFFHNLPRSAAPVLAGRPLRQERSHGAPLRAACGPTSGVSLHSASTRQGGWDAGCARPPRRHVQRVPHPTGCSRSGTAEVDSDQQPGRREPARLETGRKDRAAPEPVTGRIHPFALPITGIFQPTSSHR